MKKFNKSNLNTMLRDDHDGMKWWNEMLISNEKFYPGDGILNTPMCLCTYDNLSETVILEKGFDEMKTKLHGYPVWENVK